MPAADYLREFPSLRDDPEAAIEVIYGEFLLREEVGEAPELGEYQRDHPEYAAQLAIQVELHRALEGRSGDGSSGDTGVVEPSHQGPGAGPLRPPAGAPAPEGYEILEVLGQHGPYRVRWQSDGHESIIYPGSDASIEHFSRHTRG